MSPKPNRKSDFDLRHATSHAAKTTSKGQFFIVGALLICSVMFISLPLSAPLIAQPSSDLGYISENLRAELPRALDMGLNESAPLARLANFTRFVERALAERRINYTSLLLVMKNDTGTYLNVTGLNSMGEAVDVFFNVSGEDIYYYEEDPDSWSASASCTPSCSKAVDGDWNSDAGSTTTSVTVLINESYYIPDKVLSANWTYRIKIASGTYSDIKYYDYNAGQWSVLHKYNYSSNGTYEDSGVVQIPSNGLSGTQLRLSTRLAPPAKPTFYYEGKAGWRVMNAKTNLTLANATVKSTRIPYVSQLFNITISFCDQNETFSAARQKTGLYAFFRLKRGNDVIKNRVFG